MVRRNIRATPLIGLGDTDVLTGAFRQLPEMLVFSKPIWNKLSKDDQALVLKLGRQAQISERVLWNEYEAKALAKMREAGIQVVTIADKAPFQAAVKPVWDKYAPQFADVIKRIQAVQ